MLKEFETLQKVKDVSSRNAKEALLRTCDTPLMRELVVLAFDYKMTYGITIDELPSMKGHTWAQPSEMIDAFRDLASRLSTRFVSGDRARKEADDFLSEAGDNAVWFMRILNGDLKCGADVKTFNKVYKGCVDLFEVQLAKEYEPGKIDLPIALEIKFDGLRCVTLVENGKGVCYSRNGHEFTALQDFADEMVRMGAGVYDGEILADSWNATSSISRSKKGDEQTRKMARENCTYNVFDYLSLEDFKLRYAPHTQKARRIELEKRYKNVVWPQIVLTEQFMCYTDAQVQAHFEDFISQGHEGVMIKDLDAPYECKRSRNWSKLKPWRDDVGVITECFEGKDSITGMLGAFNVRLENGVEFHLGGGFSRENRQDFWNRRKELIGERVEFKYALRPGVVEASPTLASYLRFRPAE